MDADEIIARYELTPHPEGGQYREIFRASAEDGSRGAVTSIYYLLRAGELSAWHRVDAVEIWHYHAGDALRLELSLDGVEIKSHRLGVGRGCVASGRGSRRCLAKRASGGRLDTGRVHGSTSFRVRRASSWPHPAGIPEARNRRAG